MRPLQDEATRAWNLHTALYYKAGGTPWRLKDDPAKLQTCFVGVGFFRTLDRERISTAMAQVFNERGKGVVVRGGPATIAKDDRQPHLDADGAYQLMILALHKYEDEHFTRPARVVVHKTSAHSPAEIDGFRKAVDEYRVHSCELLSMDRSFVRLFRNAEYPPLRGTFLSLDANSHVLVYPRQRGLLRNLSGHVHAAVVVDRVRSRRTDAQLLGKRNARPNQDELE